MRYIVIITLFILGTLMLIKPHLLWKIEHILDVKNGEPTELYITIMRVMGTFLIIGSLILNYGKYTSYSILSRLSIKLELNYIIIFASSAVILYKIFIMGV